MSLRLAVIVSHPIQHFAPWHRELAKLSDIDLRVFFCCDWGVNSYHDAGFGVSVKWDIPLLEGYSYELLRIARRPARLDFRQVDNPEVAESLERFDPHVLKVFGYAHRTNWRAARWARRKHRPLMLYSDSNARRQPVGWKRFVKKAVVSYFYSYVDGALFVGDSNFEYHQRYGLPLERLFPGVLPIDQQHLHSTVTNRGEARRVVRELHGIPQDAFVINYSGKFMPYKRPLDLAEAVGALARQGLPIWTLMIGDGPQRSAVEDYCLRETVNNVVVTGFINQSRLPAYYAASDVLAVTSSLDAHPLVVSEGASFGLPVIVSDKVGCIGTFDTARPGENALVYSCGDVRGLRGAIEELYDNPEKYQRMSDAALKIAREQDVTIAAAKLKEAVYRLRELGPRHAPVRAGIQ